MNAKLWAISVVAIAFCGLARAQDGPTDPFVGASPSFDSAAPDQTEHNSGEWGVSEQRGAATYTYAVECDRTGCA